MTNEKGPILEPMLVLMRHAARDFSEDGLSTEGERQSERLQDLLASFGIRSPLMLQSSPKRRTRATLRPLAQALGCDVLINGELDERAPHESSALFDERVKEFCNGLDLWAASLTAQSRQNETATRLACSHLDWLEAASQFLSSDDSELERSEPWPAMSLRIYKFQNGIWRRRK